jgi:hypothetical protein
VVVPKQTGGAEKETVGNKFTKTVLVATAVQLKAVAAVKVTEYVPEFG